MMGLIITNVIGLKDTQDYFGKQVVTIFILQIFSVSKVTYLFYVSYQTLTNAVAIFAKILEYITMEVTLVCVLME